MAITPAPAKFAPLLFAGDWQAGLQTALELGYNVVELSLRNPQAQVVKDLGRTIAGSGGYLGDSHRTVPLQRWLERMKGFVEFAAPYEASVIIGGIRGTLEGGDQARAEQRKRATEAIRSYARYAEPAGVHLLIESINRYETTFMNTVAEALSFIKEVGARNLRVLADTFHMNIEEVSLVGALEAAGEWLGYVHLPDSNRQAAGQSHIDFRELVAVLRKMDHNGYIWGRDPADPG